LLPPSLPCEVEVTVESLVLRRWGVHAVSRASRRRKHRRAAHARDYRNRIAGSANQEGSGSAAGPASHFGTPRRMPYVAANTSAGGLSVVTSLSTTERPRVCLALATSSGSPVDEAIAEPLIHTMTWRTSFLRSISHANPVASRPDGGTRCGPPRTFHDTPLHAFAVLDWRRGDDAISCWTSGLNSPR
jgi:hypothetical protein